MFPTPVRRAALVAALLLASSCSTAARRTVEPVAIPSPSPGSPRVSSDPGPCTAARRDWSESSGLAREALAALDGCLAGGVPTCAMETAAARATLAELSIQAHRVFGACPSGR